MVTVLHRSYGRDFGMLGRGADWCAQGPWGADVQRQIELQTR